MSSCTLRGHNTTARHTLKQSCCMKVYNRRYAHLSNPHVKTIAPAQSVKRSQEPLDINVISYLSCIFLFLLRLHFRILSMVSLNILLTSTSTPTCLTNIGQAIIGDEHPLTSTTTSVFNSNKVSSILQSFGTVRDDCLIYNLTTKCTQASLQKE